MITKTAYCYCRVSKNEQSVARGGFGMTRQQSMILNYIEGFVGDAECGYALSIENVVWLKAEGISGFSGKNIEKGSVLLEFIDAVTAGRIKNAVLIIENIDRFSRVTPNLAVELFLRLVNNGCPIHECEYEIIHNQYSDNTLISAGLTRSNAESVRKQKLSIKNWDKRFEAVIKKGAVLTAKCPSWLRVNESKQYEIIETEAITIRKVFELYNKGFGQAYIRDYLNDRGLKFNGKTIGTWIIHKILNDERLTGKLRVKSEIRKQYDGLRIYPIIIEQQIFNSVKVMLKSKKRGIKITKRVNNLFSGVSKCGYCRDAHLVVQLDGNIYRCGHALQSNQRCIAPGFKYDIVERAIINHMLHFDFDINTSDRSEEIERLDNELINTIKYRDEVQKDIDSVDIPDQSDRRILKNLQKKVDEVALEIDKLKAEGNITNEIKNITRDIDENLLDVSNIEIRTEFNIKIRRIIKQFHAMRWDQSTIFIWIEYYAASDMQLLYIDAKTGMPKQNIYMEGNKLVVFTTDGKLEFFNEQFYLNGVEISKKRGFNVMDKSWLK